MSFSLNHSPYREGSILLTTGLILLEILFMDGFHHLVLRLSKKMLGQLNGRHSASLSTSGNVRSES
jgi:hypothetical protein